MTEFSDAERAYLSSQRLGRMATVDPAGQPQANPVGIYPQPDGTILIGGLALATTKKWRNLQSNPKVALVVDDIVSLDPWTVRGVDIRGEAELLVGPHDLGPQFSEELIRVHPRKVISWGLDERD
ncbi:PPOX class F420-dependent oxidoreductase [Streptomyces sp. NBC_01433]|uniref:PPOX class F420-dependent oxidoreductase n=1 Tax=Streptomyces sp. NBC_01433 TaxID=2903864 RepID=UPI0022531501|nr:PPOX class F420-dependent oxidoreductase [Streptomyces sp. NBC_01433]MCX4680449.1 PPOX class F420-dependent oxidoreductase [Streptomyces sp. NBC_01433]